MRALLARPARLARPLAAGVGAIAGLAACSSILGVESDRHLVVPAPDAGGSGANGADWSCLHAASGDAPGGDTVTLEYALIDVTTQSSGDFFGAPVVGASVRACANLDPVCDHPQVLGTTDDAGVARMTVGRGFDGYYEVTDASDFAPSILKRTPQLVDEHADQGLAKTQLIDYGASIAQVAVDPAKAFVVITAADCRSTPAPGVRFAFQAADPSEKLIYIQEQLPTLTATETDAAGSAIVFNVPPGSLAVTGSIASTGETIRTTTALVRQGWATFVQIRVDSSRVIPLRAPAP